MRGFPVGRFGGLPGGGPGGTGPDFFGTGGRRRTRFGFGSSAGDSFRGRARFGGWAGPEEERLPPPRLP